VSYVDAFIAAVPTANQARYREHARITASVFKAHGALSVVECWGNDVPEGTVTSLPMAVKRQDGETVTLGWITWASRQARDEGMKKAMADPRMQNIDMPFDGQRMIFGGFDVMQNV
jgi:uncharacterized protein YbaA (DUF1428 family)